MIQQLTTDLAAAHAEIERLSLRCQRADECIVAFEDATGGLPAVKRMLWKTEALESETERLRGMLKSVEWIEDYPDVDAKRCPVCLEWKANGHEAGCEMDAALKENGT